ncbi:MAG: hypothetical protein ABIM50_11640 [Novosphingobium sp.]
MVASSSAEAKRRAPLPPPPPPAPAPVVIVIPPRPMPPMGAPTNMVVPPFGADGKRVATNAGLNPDQITWNMRSALNVGALDCNDPQYAEIQAGYRAFLRTHAKRLAAANRGVDTGFRARFGAGFVRQRETYLTRVYNFYAFPPVMQKFCDATLLIMRDLPAVTSLQLHNFAALSMPKLDQIYEDFYRDYAKYQIDFAIWNARYLPPAPTPILLPAAPPTPILLPAAPPTPVVGTAPAHRN